MKKKGRKLPVDKLILGGAVEKRITRKEQRGKEGKKYVTTNGGQKNFKENQHIIIENQNKVKKHAKKNSR